MAFIPASDPRAKGTFVRDSSTGKQIPHVRSIDPDTGVLLMYRTMRAHPDAPMTITRDGVSVTLPYTFIETRDDLGNRIMDTEVVSCAFDVVRKSNGEIVASCRQSESSCPLRYADPERYWKERSE